MGITNIGFSLLLVGIPALAGTHMVVSSFGRKSVSNGISILLYAIAVSAALAYFLPEGRISRGDYQITAPSVLILCIVLGVISGFISRYRGK
jgi:hypothetical protein